MKNIMCEQIKDLFTWPERVMKSGLWFSGSKGEGVFKAWWENGNIHMISHYENGQREGEHKQWYVDGTPAIYCIYKNGTKYKYLELHTM